MYVHTDTFAIIHTDTCGLDKIESVAVVQVSRTIATAVVEERNTVGRTENRLTFCGSCVAREVGQASNPVGPQRPAHTLMAPRWASVNKREWPGTGQYRHLVRRGHHTSVCGTTALPASIWRGNTTKPPCPECVRKNGETP